MTYLAYFWGHADHGDLDEEPDHEALHEPTLVDDLVGESRQKATWVQIACGWSHVVHLSKNGEVFAWGYGDDGRLGLGDIDHTHTPTKVELPSGEKIVKIACGDNHTVALTATGKVLTWGNGEFGQLGHGDNENVHKPKIVEALGDEVIVDVMCGLANTFAFTSSGSMFYWGGDLMSNDKVVPTPHPLRSIPGASNKIISRISATGDAANNDDIVACATTFGELYTWGSGYFGKLGHGNTDNQPVPKLVEALSGVFCTDVDVNGFYHTVVLSKDGKVYTFGRGYGGMLGHGDQSNKFLPSLVRVLEAIHIIQVKSGEYHTIALSSSGYVFSWGCDNYSHDDECGTCKRSKCLGHGQSYKGDCLTIPRLVEALRTHNVVQLACGGQHCVALVDPSPSSIRIAQQSQFNNKDDSDVTFMVENSTPIYASIDVLSKKSQYFEAMFRIQMKESIERTVVLPDDVSREVFLKLLEYLCLDGFTLLADVDVSRRLLLLADMYLLDGLCLLCKDHIERGS